MAKCYTEELVVAKSTAEEQHSGARVEGPSDQNWILADRTAGQKAGCLAVAKWEDALGRPRTPPSVALSRALGVFRARASVRRTLAWSLGEAEEPSGEDARGTPTPSQDSTRPNTCHSSPSGNAPGGRNGKLRNQGQRLAAVKWPSWNTPNSNKYHPSSRGPLPLPPPIRF